MRGKPSAATGPAAVTLKTTGLRHSVRALRHRNFAIFWTGALISNSGTWVQNATVPYVLYLITRSEAWVGFATFAQFIPGVFVGPLGGSLADRFDRRRLLLVTQALLAAAAVVLWLSWLGGTRSPLLILVLVSLSGLLSGLNIPSWQAFVPALVPREDLLSAITLNSLQFNAARAIGAGLAGVVLAKLGASNAFLLNALSYVSVLAALAAVRLSPHIPRRHTERGIIRQFGAALRYTRLQTGIGIGVVVSILIAGLGNPITQFAVVFAEDVYRVGRLEYGILAAAMGIGALVAAPLVSGWDTVMPRGDVVRIGLPLYGGACALFGLSTSFALGVTALILAGGAFLAVISATNTAVQVIVAERMRGRVMAVRVMSFTLAFSFGGLIQGWLAEWVGPRVTVAGAGLVLTAAGLVLAARPHLMRRLDDPADPDGDLDTAGAAAPAPLPTR